jgi:hypothetical protein
MMTFLQVPAIVVLLLSWLGTAPLSLADAARREAFRRSLLPKSTLSLTNADLPAAAVTTPDDPAAATPPQTDAAKPAPTPRSAATIQAEAAAQDEAAWRSRMSAAREALAHDQLLVDALQSRFNALTTEAIARDDPAQRAKIELDRAKAYEELTKRQKAVEADEKAISAIQDEARRLGIPPGWIRWL